MYFFDVLCFVVQESLKRPTVYLQRDVDVSLPLNGNGLDDHSQTTNNQSKSCRNIVLVFVACEHVECGSTVRRGGSAREASCRQEDPDTVHILLDIIS